MAQAQDAHALSLILASLLTLPFVFSLLQQTPSRCASLDQLYALQVQIATFTDGPDKIGQIGFFR
jgi:hypothetical protein